MKAKFNGKEYRVSEIIDGGERWFEIEEIEEVKDQPEAPEAPEQPQRKFKAGDKVRIKGGISSRTHRGIGLSFTPLMDELIGKELTVKVRSSFGHICVLETIFIFAEEWLEPWSYEKEELKEGDMAIFWDHNVCNSHIKVFSKKEGTHYYDDCATPWKHAVKFECTKEQKEQFEKIRNGSF